MRVPVRAAIVVLLAFGALATSGDQGEAPTAPPPAPPPAAQPTPRPETQLEEFVPSEKVKADDAVAFPVDI